MVPVLGERGLEEPEPAQHEQQDNQHNNQGDDACSPAHDGRGIASRMPPGCLKRSASTTRAPPAGQPGARIVARVEHRSS